MAYPIEDLLTSEVFLLKVERVVRFTAGDIADEDVNTAFHAERFALAGIVADDATAARELAIRFTRILITAPAIRTAAANDVPHDQISDTAVAAEVARLWNLIARRRGTLRAA